MWCFTLSIVFFLVLSCHVEAEKKEHHIVLTDQKLLLISTLNGALVAVDKASGNKLWTLSEDPVLDVPLDPSYSLKLLPNPSDGSLYSLGRNGDQLERLPLTIPELVHASPSQSSDGLLYTARKSDVWLAVDLLTGTKLHSLTTDGVLSCPTAEYPGPVLHIARTAYTVTVFDKETNTQRWNATYMAYVSNTFEGDSSNDLLHFSSSSDGMMLSLDRLTGKLVWQNAFESPVVAVYAVEGGALRKVPITTTARCTMNRLTGSSVLALRTDTFGIKATDAVLQSSLFIGFQDKQLYAMNSLVDEEEVKAEFQLTDQSRNVPLIEGPAVVVNQKETGVAGEISQSDAQVIDTGHYCLPIDSDLKFYPLSKQIELEFLALVKSPINRQSDYHLAADGEPRKPSVDKSYDRLMIPVTTFLLSTLAATSIAVFITWITNKKQALFVQPQSPSGSRGSMSQGSNESRSLNISHSSSSFQGSDTTVSRVTDDGNIVVGKITYSRQEILGHGSEGTVVFRGEFDTRPVAVKRMLPECFQLADREVDLLRQSDQHPNVVRYFCMEQDVSFRYIALELCQSTLHEYVVNWQFDNSGICPSTVLYEAIKGLTYLHASGIVHRDIKPRNVLLSFPGVNGEIRTKISDFGLCRKLAQGKVSFTAKSGVTGTEGWIAPEVLEGNKRVTNAVDIFSMGCVIYYVLSAGQHPFGSSLRRQANIESGDYSLNDLNGSNKHTASELVKDMISHNYMFRPTSAEVLSHCLFWKRDKQLAFFQDVSDRIEKEPVNSPIVQALEQGGQCVVKGDWRNHISDELREDLRRFRSYHGTSVRELLRAMRNKKHHYRELPEDLKKALGNIPDDFVDYFTKRFPLLLIHTFKQMQICKPERLFSPYYTDNFR
ncbi:serine/threonine-protein kinase/endoribonuclease IRE1-like isoform X2 [Halichondria panicea]|uniref:serine/threonine-protein kinase/endoribonuclease IRE1-like isoform X2 n=1 Tax=Halichondria panicea TaxID=6063 RepID=UPI00312B5F6C